VLVDMPQNQGYLGVPLKLIVVYKDVTSNDEPTLPEIDGFSIQQQLGTEKASQTTFINGKVTSTSTTKYTFILTPERVGTLEIPAITFVADGKAFQTVPKVIEIVETPTSGALKVEVNGTKNDVYLGQPIDMTLRIFIEQFTDPTLGITLDARDMFSLLGSNSSFGMFSEALQDGRASVQTVRGTTEEGVPATFYVYSVQATSWPETTGEYVFEPISIIANYPISLSRQQRSTIFGGSSLTVSQSQLISAQAELPTLQVLTTPEQDRPAWFTGAVGIFDFRIVAEPTHINVGEPITLTMRVTDRSSGPVNLDYLSAPALDRVATLTSSFKVPDKPLGGITEGRTKTFTQTIRPRQASVTEIPPLPMSSFNPNTNTYETVWTAAIPISVHAVATVSASDLVGGNGTSPPPPSQNLTEVDGGILANYTGNALLISQTTSVTPALLFAIVFPPMTCLVIAIALFYQRRTQTDTSKQKCARKNAIKMIRSIPNVTNAHQVQQISIALRTLHAHDASPSGVTALLNRCDAAQFGCFTDDSLGKDANILVEAMAC
jgi:hypothetical protein